MQAARIEDTLHLPMHTHRDVVELEDPGDGISTEGHLRGDEDLAGLREELGDIKVGRGFIPDFHTTVLHTTSLEEGRMRHKAHHITPS